VAVAVVVAGRGNHHRAVHHLVDQCTTMAPHQGPSRVGSRNLFTDVLEHHDRSLIDNRWARDISRPRIASCNSIFPLVSRGQQGIVFLLFLCRVKGGVGGAPMYHFRDLGVGGSPKAAQAFKSFRFRFIIRFIHFSLSLSFSSLFFFFLVGHYESFLCMRLFPPHMISLLPPIHFTLLSIIIPAFHSPFGTRFFNVAYHQATLRIIVIIIHHHITVSL